MNYSDETLMAFADGELDEQTTREVEQAVQADAALAAIVARHRALRADVFAAFAPVLNEPVPEKLSNAVSAAVVATPPGMGRLMTSKQSWWSWKQLGGMAAMLALGLSLGRMAGMGETGAMLAAVGKDGALTAQGPLAQALSQQLTASAPAGNGTRIGLSFLSKDGHYCRSFATGGSAGLACRQAEQWQITVMSAGKDQAGAYRQAGSDMPQAVLDAIDQMISGQALDGPAEAAARAANWQKQK